MRSVLTLLLWLHPPAFRRRHGAEIRQFVRTAGCAPDFDAPRIILDLLLSLVREWADALSWRGRRRPRRELVGNVARDFRYSARLLARTPGFTFAAIVTLALGIGANTAILSLADATLLRPFKVRQPHQLFAGTSVMSYPDLQEAAGHTDLFESVAGLSGGGNAAVGVDGVTELRPQVFVSASLFDLLGVGPVAGRLLHAPDDAAGDVMAVISQAFWMARFGGRHDAVGKTIHVNGRPVTIAGVAPGQLRGLALFGTPDVYLPITSLPRVSAGRMARGNMLASRGVRWIRPLFRVRDGVTPEQVASLIDTLMRRDAGGTFRGPGRAEPFAVRPIAVAGLGAGSATTRRFVLLLAGVVVLTLLIACANLANLLLARGASRRREIGVRIAVGASRGRVAREVLVESLMLSVAGGLAGLYVAHLALGLLGGQELPGGVTGRMLGLSLDPFAVTASAGLSVFTGLLFGGLPAWRATRLDPVVALRDDNRSSSARSGVRAGLVAAQIALSVALLAGAGLFVRSLLRALDVPLGFRPEGVVVAMASPGLGRLDQARAETFYNAALERIAASVPGVDAAWSSFIPGGGMMEVSLDVAGYQPAPDEDMVFQVARVSPGYFAAIGTDVRAGRPFTTGDGPAAPAVAILNEAAANRYFGGQAVGRRIRTAGQNQVWSTIVGVVEDTRASLTEAPVPMAYYPFSTGIEGEGVPADRAYLLARGDADARALRAVVAGHLRAADPAMPVEAVGLLEERAARFLTPQRMGATLFGLFSALALALAVVGVYGVSVYVAALRSREIAIRIALGASRRDITRLMLRQGAMPVLAGMIGGSVLALWSSRFAAALLFGTTPWDPATFITVNLLLAAVSLVAIYVPARRAARQAPVNGLRA